MQETTMITEATGNLLLADVDVLVNTVNTVGVMGKGIALQFKQAFPDNFDAYAKACKRGDVKLGEVFFFATDQLTPRWIANFPTKRHWRSRSRISDIERGLADLRSRLSDMDVTSVAIPPLGCGNGGLEWQDVRPRIVAALEGMDIDVILYPPQAPPEPAAMPIRTEQPDMTLGRAALVALIAGYDTSGFGVSPIELQKLMYFMQESGESLRLAYGKQRYGPYAENLNHVLQRVEGHFLHGYGDRSQLVADATPLAVSPDAIGLANDWLSDHPATRERVERVLALARGFDSPYGMELLATVHWVLSHEWPAAKPVSDESVTEGVRNWSRRKRDLFSADHIQLAVDHLIQYGWLPPLHELSGAA